MENQSIAHVDPGFLRKEGHQIVLYLDGVLSLRKPHAMGESKDVSVYNDAGCFPETISHHDVRRLSSHTRETEQLVHCLGHPTAEVVSDLLAGSLDRLRFVAVETGGADELLQLAPIRMGESGRLGKTSEQGGRYFVDPLIRALGGQNGCDQQFERRPVIEGGSGPRKLLAELADDLAGALPSLFLSFSQLRPSRRPLRP